MGKITFLNPITPVYSLRIYDWERGPKILKSELISLPPDHGQSLTHFAILLDHLRRDTRKLNSSVEYIRLRNEYMEQDPPLQ